MPRRVCFLFGQEGPGLSAGAREECDATFSIAQFGSTRSINASAAGAIAMHAWVRTHADLTGADAWRGWTARHGPGQHVLERGQPARGVALDRALADPEVGRGLGHREPEPVPQQHGLALHLRQRVQRLEERVALLDGERGRCGPVVRPSPTGVSRRHGRRLSSMLARTMIVRA